MAEHVDALFAAYLEEHHEGRGNFDAFCAEHSEHAEELKRLYALLAAAGELDDAPTQVEPGVSTKRLEHVEEFELIREIGRGGMGIVYEAQDRILHRRVAVKLLPASRLTLEDARKRFEREISALGRLSHPHLVAIYRSGLEHEPPYLAMELVRGGASLEARLAELQSEPTHRRRAEDLLGEARGDSEIHERSTATLEPGKDSRAATQTKTRSEERGYFGVVARLLAETAEALEHSHAQGVLHRDVKPANILVDARGSARLVDFGVARLADEASLTATGGFAGTPSYAAPEQLSSEKAELDGRTDVYALGVTLYRLLTGVLPFEPRRNGDTRELYHRILQEVPLEPHRCAEGVPWELSVICAKALEKRPERRYSSAQLVAADLRAWLARRPILARPPTPWRRLMHVARRRPVLSGVLTAAAAALLLAGAIELGRNAWTGWELRGEARAFLASIPERKQSLAESFAAYEGLSLAWDALQGDALERPLSDEERGERARLDRERTRARDASVKRVWDELSAMRAFAGVLDEAELQRGLDELVEPSLLFARRAGSTELERDLLRLARREASEVLDASDRGAFALRVEPADADVYLFRYVEERQLTEEWRSQCSYPVPCDREGRLPRDREGRLLGFPVDAEWSPGKSYPIDPAEPEGERTLYPLFTSEDNRVAANALPSELPRGSYLLLVRAEGYAEARLPLFLNPRLPEYEPQLEARLDRLDEVPSGFVRVDGGPFLSGGDRGRSYQAPPFAVRDVQPFYIARKELSFGEYLEVLRWKQDHGGRVAKHLPRDYQEEVEPAPWNIDVSTMTIRPAELASLPVCSIRFEDAVAWCAYATERAESRGEPWIFELPWAMSWEKAARGADGRIFAWGSEFDWAFAYGRRTEYDPSRPEDIPWMPVASKRCLGDESPYGLLGVTGNVEEFVYRDDRLGPERSPGNKGGGLARLDPMSFRLPRYVSHLPLPSRGTGFRPVLRRRDMARQGSRGDAPRLVPTEPSHD